MFVLFPQYIPLNVSVRMLQCTALDALAGSFPDHLSPPLKRVSLSTVHQAGLLPSSLLIMASRVSSEMFCACVLGGRFQTYLSLVFVANPFQFNMPSAVLAVVFLNSSW